MPMTTVDKPLLLVDGSSYLYRAFHALPPLSTRGGEPTGALYGVVSMLRKLIEEYQPEYIAVVFDAPGKTFRDELFTAYKANRSAMPEELVHQIEPLHALVRAMGLPLLQVPKVEADDVIGTLAKQAAADGMQVVIVSGDKDMAQLVNEHITVLDTMKNTIMDVTGVEKKFAVPPDRVRDYLALVGDSSDNIPGVPGVGPKTAAKWLREYGSLEAIMASAASIKGKVGDRLREHLDQLPLFRQLATLHCDLKLGLKSEQLRRIPADVAALKELFRHYEFSTWLRQLNEADSQPKVDTIERRYQLILDEAALTRWLERLRAAELFAFDTETTSLNYQRARLVGLSFAVIPAEAAYVPLAHEYNNVQTQLNQDRVLERLKPLLEDPQRGKLGQNLKYDLHVLAHYGIQLAGIRHDTMLESYVLDSTATRHDMDSLAEKYLGLQTIHYEDVVGKGIKQLNFSQIPLEQAALYAAEDADITLRLHRHLWPKLMAEPSLRNLYEQIELPLIAILARMERTGVLVDVEPLHRLSSEIAKRLLALEQQAHVIAGQPFNLSSPKQLQQILFQEQRLPVIKRTPTGQSSTAEDVLQELALEYPLPRIILEHRMLSKLKSTYTDKLPKLIDPATGRVHTSYHQAVTSTGRLSSSDPNLQNIPIRSEEGRRIRQAFIAPPGYRILAADYSQIELRIMAHLSGDKDLLWAFAEGKDIHRATAAEVFGIPLAMVSPEQRRAAKAINFGLIYGMSAFGLARQLGIGRVAAQDYIDRYFARYPQVKTFMENTRRQAAERGYVETLFGRRLYLAQINARNPQRRQAAERTAINAPMQGSAADIIKRAMIGVDQWLRESGCDARMIMQVHDELVFEVAEAVMDEARERIRACMVAAESRIPLEVAVGVGCNWDEAH